MYTHTHAHTHTYYQKEIGKKTYLTFSYVVLPLSRALPAPCHSCFGWIRRREKELSIGKHKRRRKLGKWMGGWVREEEVSGWVGCWVGVFFVSYTFIVIPEMLFFFRGLYWF